MKDICAVYLFQREWAVSIAAPQLTDIVISPNPSTTGILSIHTKTYIGKLVSLELVSLAGQPLFSQEILLEESWRHNFSSLPTGIYLLRISGEGVLPTVVKWMKE